MTNPREQDSKDVARADDAIVRFERAVLAYDDLKPLMHGDQPGTARWATEVHANLAAEAFAGAQAIVSEAVLKRRLAVVSMASGGGVPVPKKQEADAEAARIVETFVTLEDNNGDPVYSVDLDGLRDTLTRHARLSTTYRIRAMIGASA